MIKLLRRIHKLTESPYTAFLIGVILLVSSGLEIYQSLESLTIGAHHGVFVWAVAQILSASAHIIEGLGKTLVEAED